MTQDTFQHIGDLANKIVNKVETNVRGRATMELRDYNEIKQHMLHVINSIAPNGKVQRAAVTQLHEFEDHEPDLNRRITWLAGVIIDGLSYGNWIGLSTNECFELVRK